LQYSSLHLASQGWGRRLRCGRMSAATVSGRGRGLAAFWDGMLAGRVGVGFVWGLPNGRNVVGRARVFRGFRIGLGFGDGFDRLLVFLGREHVAEFEEAVEIFDGEAMEALGLGLKAEQDIGEVRLAIEAVESEDERVGIVLSAAHFEAVCELGLAEEFPRSKNFVASLSIREECPIGPAACLDPCA